MNGFFLVNKEKNYTSNDVVQKIKKKFSFKKVGHLGTLDPIAEGLIILAAVSYTHMTLPTIQPV